jgi:hypothetical protein
VIPSGREPSKDTKLFGQVWYLPGENQWQDRDLLAYPDLGRLIVPDHAREFLGRVWKLAISQIRSVSIGKRGRDFTNNWVRIEHRSRPKPNVAFFADGRWLSRSGLLGGTRGILYAVVQKLI